MSSVASLTIGLFDKKWSLLEEAAEPIAETSNAAASNSTCKSKLAKQGGPAVAHPDHHCACWHLWLSSRRSRVDEQAHPGRHWACRHRRLRDVLRRECLGCVGHGCRGGIASRRGHSPCSGVAGRREHSRCSGIASRRGHSRCSGVAGRRGHSRSSGVAGRSRHSPRGGVALRLRRGLLRCPRPPRSGGRRTRRARRRRRICWGPRQRCGRLLRGCRGPC